MPMKRVMMMDMNRGKGMVRMAATMRLAMMMRTFMMANWQPITRWDTKMDMMKAIMRNMKDLMMIKHRILTKYHTQYET